MVEKRKVRFAVVATRFGDGFVGGAEASLRTMAESLHAAGHCVEVFTISGSAPGRRRASVPATQEFSPEPCDPDRFAAAADLIRRSDGVVSRDTEQTYWQNSQRSTDVIDALRSAEPFDAILVGPYLSGLTREVARAFPDRTLLVPCFHNEPFARLPEMLNIYRGVAGVIYHSPEEKRFAEAELGLNHPNAVCAGAWLDVRLGNADQGRKQVANGRRYLVYCGRYHRDKEVTRLIEFARRYDAKHPSRFLFAFLGEGELRIPAEPWVRDLGLLAEDAKRDVLAGADALMQFSPNESLSLAVLEAQAQGVPVIVNGDNPVLAGHLDRGKGGRGTADYASFAAALNDLWDNPEAWRGLGENGRQYVCKNFGDRAAFVARLLTAVHGLTMPLAEQMRRKGLERAAQFSRPAWREQFNRLVEHVLHVPVRAGRDEIEIMPATTEFQTQLSRKSILVPVRVINRGDRPALPSGPSRVELISRVKGVEAEAGVTPLPGLVVPGKDRAAVVAVTVPDAVGDYDVEFGLRRQNVVTWFGPQMTLIVKSATVGRPAVRPAPALVSRRLEELLSAARAVELLPDGYVDVTAGRFAQLKRWVKTKLLQNFRRGYVDVVSRQQSAFNGRIADALAELAENQDRLAHAVETLNEQLRKDDGTPMRYKKGSKKAPRQAA